MPTKQRTEREEAKERTRFVEAAFLVALPSAILASGWKMDDKAVYTITQRVELAWRIAYEAWAQRQGLSK